MEAKEAWENYSDKIQIFCRYFKNNVHYPFEELGCKFEHDPFENDDDQDRVIVDMKVEDDRETTNDTSNKDYSSITDENKQEPA